MSSQLDQQRPQGSPPDNRPKQKLDAVIAQDAEGNFYQIPSAQAEQFKAGSLHGEDRGQSGSEDEVGGRDARWLTDGTFGYHSNWCYGPYVWWRDLRSYTGWHWHPNKYEYRAYDQDD